jgi:hypothetical protein
LWHAVWHQGDAPRYCLITSWESGDDLGSYIDALHPQPKVDSAPLDPEFADKAYAVVAQRRADREAALAARAQQETEVMSEA